MSDRTSRINGLRKVQMATCRNTQIDAINCTSISVSKRKINWWSGLLPLSFALAQFENYRDLWLEARCLFPNRSTSVASSGSIKLDCTCKLKHTQPMRCSMHFFNCGKSYESSFRQMFEALFFITFSISLQIVANLHVYALCQLVRLSSIFFFALQI